MKRVVVLALGLTPLVVAAACTSFGTDDSPMGDGGPDAPVSSADGPATDATASDVVTLPGNCPVDAPFGPPIKLGGLEGYGVEAVRFGTVRNVVYLSLCAPPDGKDGCDMYQGVTTDKADTFGNFSSLAVNAAGAYDSYPTVTADTQWLFFGSARLSNKAKLFRAHAEAGVFANPTEQATSFAASNEPYLLGNGHTFYFAASIGLSPPQWDIYRAVGNVPDFGEPERLNTLDDPGTDEFAPVPSEDELEIFFASSRAPGTGSNLDIWHAVRANANDGLGPPEHLAGDINGPNNDFPTSLSPDHCDLYSIRKVPGTGAGTGVGVAYVSRRPRPSGK